MKDNRDSKDSKGNENKTKAQTQQGAKELLNTFWCSSSFGQIRQGSQNKTREANMAGQYGWLGS